ncbi:MAG: tyrosine-type recombinase/integrase, partial [Hyphomicrobiaceae bacterium]
TFRQAFEAFFALKAQTLANPKHSAQWRATMETYVFPHIGSRAVSLIQPHEIIDILAPIWFDKRETAHRVLQRIEAVFKSAILRGAREQASPCIGVAQELGGRSRAVRHHRSLPYADVPAFVVRLRALPPTMARLALEWLILTASRSGETRGARWDEIDEKAALWAISAERMKAKRPHVVPLPTPCVDVLARVRVLGRKSDLVFPGTDDDVPLSDMTLTKALRDMDIADRATVHGFRSSFKMWAAEVAKVRDEVSEAALAHVIPDKVRAAYLRSDFLDERRRLMQQWVEHARGGEAVKGTVETVYGGYNEAAEIKSRKDASCSCLRDEGSNLARHPRLNISTDPYIIEIL